MPGQRMMWCAAVAAGHVMLACCVVSCASEPKVPKATSTPEPGDSVDQIAQRGYLLSLDYVFAVDGHEYSLASTRSEWSNQSLILIDGHLACVYAFQSEGAGFQEWEWVAEPNGLGYLASRVRQACGLEPPTPPRTLPSLQAAAADVTPAPAEAPADASVPSPVAEPPSAVKEVAVMAGKILIEVPLVIMAAPYLLVGETAALIVASPWIIAKNSADKHQLEQRRQMQPGLPRDETLALLGEPEVEFPLATVDTTVLMYEAGKGTKYYVGFENEHVIWIHDSYPWLNQLAKQTKEEQKHGK
jgi:hypothetical protein